MSYTLIPNAGQSLGQTRDAIRTNFSLLNTTIGVDHFTLIGDSNPGKHRIIRFPTPIITANTPATAANEISFYTKAAPAGFPQLFMKQQSIALGGADIQMTTNVTPGPIAVVYTPVSGGPSSSQCTFLPGGYFMAFGFVNVNAGILVPQTQTITLPFGFSVIDCASFSVLDPPLGLGVWTASATLIVSPSVTFNLLQAGNISLLGAIVVYWNLIGRL